MPLGEMCTQPVQKPAPASSAPLLTAGPVAVLSPSAWAAGEAGGTSGEGGS